MTIMDGIVIVGAGGNEPLGPDFYQWNFKFVARDK